MIINRNYIREHCPNIPLLRKVFTWIRLNAYKKDLMPEEKVNRCITDPVKKQLAVQAYSKKWPSRVDTMKCEIAQYGISQSNLDDVLFANIAYGMRAEEFMYYDFINKSEVERSTFLSDIKYAELTVQMNNLFDGDAYFNKANCYRTLEKYYKRDALIFDAKTSFEDLQGFVKAHPVFVKKVGRSCLGKGITKIDLSSDIEGQQLKNLYNEWYQAGDDLLLEELIQQCDIMSAFNPSSVNTIRIITYITRDGIIAPYAFLKTGKNGSFVDNGGQGGILIGIDPETGTLVTDGIDEKRNVYTVHPNTHVRYKGVTLPEWTDAVELCKEMALIKPTVKMVGWDLAHTNSGWVVVEANERSQIVGPQLIFNRGVRKEILDIMNRMDLYMR